MKKISLLIVCVFLCLIAIASLSSCGNIKATSVWSSVSRAMNKLDSYEMESYTSVVYYADGKKVSAKGEGHTIVDNIGGDDFYYYTKQDVQTSAPELELDQKVISVEAYTDGYYYIRNKTSGVDNKLCGEMSYEDFNEYINTSALPTSKLSRCKNVQKKKHSDGTRSITCSGYKDDALKDIISYLGQESYVFGCDIKDVNITVTYDKKNRITRLSYAFVFDVKDGETKYPMLNSTITYTKYNEAERTEQYIKKSGYTEVDNIKLLNDVQRRLNEVAVSDEGRFSVEVEQGFSTFGINVTHKEKSTVNYGTKDGKFYYDISSVINDEDYTIKYENGQMLTRGPTASDRDQTEQEAKQFIINLMNAASFEKTNISNIVSKGGGVYELECRSLNFLAYKNLLESNGMSYINSNQKIIVTLSTDGEVIKIESEMTIKGKISEQNVSVGADLVVKTKNTYN